MRYRVNKRTGDRISEIGLGSAYMPETPLSRAIPALRRAYEGGINYYDLAAGDEAESGPPDPPVRCRRSGAANYETETFITVGQSVFSANCSSSFLAATLNHAVGKTCIGKSGHTRLLTGRMRRLPGGEQ